MDIIQPMDLEAGYRSFATQGQNRLTTSVKLFFPLQGGIPTLNSEAYQLLSDTENAFCDEALPKLSTEFLVVGEAQSPAQQPVSSLECKVTLNKLAKSIRVVGDRYWAGGLEGASAPRPFTNLAFDWSRSFGGKGFKLNESGRGIDAVANDLSPDPLIALPNFERTNKLITSKGDRPDPINFCSVPQESPTRSQYLGTYDDKWLQQRFPGFPDDFNLKAFYMASEDQRFDHYLSGGENYELENLNHDKPLITGKLPKYRVRIFVVATKEEQELNPSDITVNDLFEVDNHIDTVTFYPNQNLGMLTFRGTIDSSTDDASQFKYMLCAYENQDSPPRDKSHYLMSLVGRIHPDLNMQFALTTKDLIPEDVPCGIAQMTETDEDPVQLLAENLKQKSEQALEQGKAESQEKLEKLIADMEAQGKDTTELKAQIQKILQPEKDEWALRYEQILARIAPPTINPDGTVNKEKIDIQKVDFRAFDDLNKLSQEHADYQLQKVKDDLAKHLDKMAEADDSPQASQAQEKLEQALLNLDLPAPLPRPQDPELMLKQITDAQHKMLQQQEKASEAGIQIEAADIDIEAIQASLEQGGEQLFEGYRLGAHMMDEGRPPLADDKDEIMNQFLQRVENGEPHIGQDYAGLNFTGMNLKGVQFNHCFLEQCNFSHCDLSECDLSNNIMARSDFTGAKLVKANLYNSNIGQCQFLQADLSEANLKNCEYGKADFTQAKLVNTDLSGSINSLEAIFRNSDLSGVHFDEPSFVELDFTGAKFIGATLPSATFIQCQLSQCDFSQADITAVNFIEAKLSHSRFVQTKMSNCRFMLKSDLSHCDFSGAIADNANFREANLAHSIFAYTQLQFADFSEADAQYCNFNGANLSQSQCMQTDFNYANLSNCNLMEANLMKARLTGTKVKKSNCYGVEFLAATVGKTDFSGSILHATKLEDWRPSKWQS